MYVYRCPECPTSVALAVSLADPPRCGTCAKVGQRGPIMYSVPESSRERVLLPLDQGPLLDPLCEASGGECSCTPREGCRKEERQRHDAKMASVVPANVEHLKAAGFLMPETQHALDWLWRHRATNGMASAFLKVGGRRCIDLVEFARLMRSKQA